MKTNTSFGRQWSKGALAICIALLICLSAGCGKRAAYVEGGHKLTRVNKGQAAPHKGVLLSEEYLAQIYETLGQPPGTKTPLCKPCELPRVKGTLSEKIPE